MIYVPGISRNFLANSWGMEFGVNFFLNNFIKRNYYRQKYSKAQWKQ